jgi:ABC-type transporter Mla MlaB component
MEPQAPSVSAHLQGDWTINGIVRQIDPLMELSSHLDQKNSAVYIDCSGIAGIDLCGFQLLYTWMHCLDIRGFKSTLVNVPETVQQSQASLGLSRLFDPDGTYS